MSGDKPGLAEHPSSRRAPARHVNKAALTPDPVWGAGFCQVPLDLRHFDKICQSYRSYVDDEKPITSSRLIARGCKDASQRWQHEARSSTTPSTTEASGPPPKPAYSESMRWHHDIRPWYTCLLLNHRVLVLLIALKAAGHHRAMQQRDVQYSSNS